MERRASVERCDTKLERIEVRLGNVDHIFGPLACGCIADIKATTCIRGRLDVYTLTGTVLSALVGCLQVMLSAPFAACIVVLGFNQARYGPPIAAKRRFATATGQCQIDPVEVHAASVHEQAQ